jgi:hypothetical protein
MVYRLYLTFWKLLLWRFFNHLLRCCCRSKNEYEDGDGFRSKEAMTEADAMETHSLSIHSVEDRSQVRRSSKWLSFVWQVSVAMWCRRLTGRCQVVSLRPSFAIYDGFLTGSTCRTAPIWWMHQLCRHAVGCMCRVGFVLVRMGQANHEPLCGKASY